MFDFERATDYIRSLELPGSALSEEIQKDALAGDDYSAGDCQFSAVFN